MTLAEMIELHMLRWLQDKESTYQGKTAKAVSDIILAFKEAGWIEPRVTFK